MRRNVDLVGGDWGVGGYAIVRVFWGGGGGGRWGMRDC